MNTWYILPLMDPTASMNDSAAAQNCVKRQLPLTIFSEYKIFETHLRLFPLIGKYQLSKNDLIYVVTRKIYAYWYVWFPNSCCGEI